MRHLVRGRKLGRTKAHRKATLQALAIALIREHRIQTTVPKAKELRGFIEPLITRAKKDTMHNRREAFSVLQNKLAVKALFEEIAPQVGDRPGGYTRVLKTGFRSGDAAEMALIELVDFNLSDSGTETGDKKKRTRRSRSGKSATETKAAGAANPAAEIAKKEVAETPAETISEVTEDVIVTEVQEETPETIVQAEPTAVAESEKEIDSASDIQEEKA